MGVQTQMLGVLAGAALATPMLWAAAPPGAVVGVWAGATLATGVVAWRRTARARARAAIQARFAPEWAELESMGHALVQDLGIPPGATAVVRLHRDQPPALWAQRPGEGGACFTDITPQVDPATVQVLAEMAEGYRDLVEREHAAGPTHHAASWRVAYTAPGVEQMLAADTARHEAVGARLSALLPPGVAVRIHQHNHRWDILFVQEPLDFADKEAMRAQVEAVAQEETERMAAPWGALALPFLPLLRLRWPGQA